MQHCVCLLMCSCSGIPCHICMHKREVGHLGWQWWSASHLTPVTQTSMTTLELTRRQNKIIPLVWHQFGSLLRCRGERRQMTLLWKLWVPSQRAVQGTHGIVLVWCPMFVLVWKQWRLVFVAVILRPVCKLVTNATAFPGKSCHLAASTHCI